MNLHRLLLRLASVEPEAQRLAVRLIVDVMVMALAGGSTPGLAHFFLMSTWRRISRGWRSDWSLQFLRDLKGVEVSVTLLVSRSRPGALGGRKSDPRFFAWLSELQGFRCFARGCERRLIFDPEQDKNKDLRGYHRFISVQIKMSRGSQDMGDGMPSFASFDCLCL
jgi:hypothetical protein